VVAPDALAAENPGPSLAKWLIAKLIEGGGGADGHLDHSPGVVQSFGRPTPPSIASNTRFIAKLAARLRSELALRAASRAGDSVQGTTVLPLVALAADIKPVAHMMAYVPADVRLKVWAHFSRAKPRSSGKLGISCAKPSAARLMVTPRSPSPRAPSDQPEPGKKIR
jgi:hypothetical protein